MLNTIKIVILRFLVRITTPIMWRKYKYPELTITDKNISVKTQKKSSSINVRVYQVSQALNKTSPAIIYFHGGGWVIGDTKAQDPMCKDLCSKTAHTIISVDYRLAPEHPFPVAVEDAIEAVNWVIAQAGNFNIDTDALFVAGDSAGGNLAAVVALEAKQLSTKLKGQILLYPVLDHYSANFASYAEFTKGVALTAGLMQWFWDLYLKHSTLLKEGEVQHPLATPLIREDVSHLPATLIILAEKDPLRDEGLAYAKKLQTHGIPVTQHLYPNVQHGFIGSVGPSKHHDDAINDINQWLQIHN